MKTTRSLVREFLKDVGAMEAPILGPKQVTILPKKERLERFRANLEHLAKRNRRLSMLMLILHILVVCLVGVSLLVVRGGQTLGVVAMGGGTALILGLLGGLRAMWREASTQDLLLTVIPSLQPAEILHLLEGIHYGKNARKG